MGDRTALEKGKGKCKGVFPGLGVAAGGRGVSWRKSV